MGTYLLIMSHKISSSGTFENRVMKWEHLSHLDRKKNTITKVSFEIGTVTVQEIWLY